jgi:hypothetical protein
MRCRFICALASWRRRGWNDPNQAETYRARASDRSDFHVAARTQLASLYAAPRRRGSWRGGGAT